LPITSVSPIVIVNIYHLAPTFESLVTIFTLFIFRYERSPHIFQAVWLPKQVSWPGPKVPVERLMSEALWIPVESSAREGSNFELSALRKTWRGSFSPGHLALPCLFV
jgi:hypothetical protein